MLVFASLMHITALATTDSQQQVHKCTLCMTIAALTACILTEGTNNKQQTTSSCMQRAENPETQAGFFQSCNSMRAYHVLALPRDAQGRKLKRIRDKSGRLKKVKAAYYRLVRPATGFCNGDMNAEGLKVTICCTVSSAMWQRMPQ